MELVKVHCSLLILASSLTRSRSLKQPHFTNVRSAGRKCWSQSLKFHPRLLVRDHWDGLHGNTHVHTFSYEVGNTHSAFVQVHCRVHSTNSKQSWSCSSASPWTGSNRVWSFSTVGDILMVVWMCLCQASHVKSLAMMEMTGTRSGVCWPCSFIQVLAKQSAKGRSDTAVMTMEGVEGLLDVPGRSLPSTTMGLLWEVLPPLPYTKYIILSTKWIEKPSASSAKSGELAVSHVSVKQYTAFPHVPLVK